MEPHGLAGRVQMTESTRRRLSEPFLIEERSSIDVKGKGLTKTWFLAGRSAAIVTMTSAGRRSAR